MDAARAPLDWARLVVARAGQNRLKCAVLVLVAYLCATLASHLLGDNLNARFYTKFGSSRTIRQAAASAGKSDQQVDPFANRPRIETRNGHLTLQAGQDKNIDFKTSGSRGSIRLNGFRMDHLVGAAQAFERSAATVFPAASNATNITASGSAADIGELYYKMITSLGKSALRVELVQLSVDRLTKRLDKELEESGKLRRRISKKNRQVAMLQNDMEKLMAKLKRNDCFNPDTGAPVCAHGATCIDQFNSYKCLCPEQYEGDTCEQDVDECQRFANTDLGCQNGGKCVNLPGGYRCKCPPQFNGIHCTEQHNDCSAASSATMCGHGKCVNLMRTETDSPSYDCVCDQGWTTDGKSPACLIDINECLVASQDEPATQTGFQNQSLSVATSATGAAYPCSQEPLVDCINLPGSFRCGPCPSGYTGNGRVCRDIDECLRNNGGCSRSPLVECINLPGSRKCGPCPPGYQTNDDSATCVRVSACQREPNGGCDPMAKCVELAGVANPDAARLCICQYPYMGPGVGANGCSLQGVAPPGGANQAGANSNNNNNDPNQAAQIGADYYDTGRLLPNKTIVIHQQDDCNPNPCQNGGACLLNDGASFECVCPPEWLGVTCQLANELECGGSLPATSRGLFKLPLNNSYASILRDATERGGPATMGARPLIETPSRQTFTCIWSISMPVGYALRLVFTNVTASRKDVSFYKPTKSPHLAWMPPAICNERLTIRQRYESAMATVSNQSSAASDTAAQQEGARVLGTICANWNQRRPGAQVGGGDLAKNGTEFAVESESSIVELEYAFDRKMQPDRRYDGQLSLAFQLNYTKIEPACGGLVMGPNADSGSVSSPKFPEFYRAGIECRYLLRVAPGRRIRLQVGEMRLLRATSSTPDSACADSVTILDGALGVDRTVLYKHCANRATPDGDGQILDKQPIISSSSTVEVLLLSRPDSYAPIVAPKQRRGFYLTYESEPGEPNCSNLYSAKRGEIRSNDYREGDSLADEDDSLAYEAANFFRPTEWISGQASATKRTTTRRPKTSKDQSSRSKIKTRCEYEIRPADQKRDHHVQIDWIDMPSDGLAVSSKSGSPYLSRLVRCMYNQLAVFKRKPASGSSLHDDPALLGVFCAGDKFNATLGHLEPLVSDGHALYLVYEVYEDRPLTGPPPSGRPAPSETPASGFRLLYRTVCHASYRGPAGQIVTQLDRDVDECIYHIRLPPNQIMSLSVELWQNNLLNSRRDADPSVARLDQAMTNNLLRLPDGSCAAQAVVLDGVIPRGPLGTLRTDRIMRAFFMKPPSTADTTTTDPSVAGPAVDRSTGGDDFVDDLVTGNSRSNSGVNLVSAGAVNSSASSSMSATTAGAGAKAVRVYEYLQYESSHVHDIKEFDVCSLPELGLNSYWNELSLLFKLNPKALQLDPLSADNFKPESTMFAIRYKSERACGGIISEPRVGSLTLTAKRPAATASATSKPTPGRAPATGNATASDGCAWIIRNPRVNLPIKLSFEHVAGKEINERRSEWINWLRTGSASGKNRSATGSTPTTKARASGSVSAGAAATPSPVWLKVSPWSWWLDSAGSQPSANQASSRFGDNPLATLANCSQAFQELVELYEPSAGRARLLCPTELVDELIWTTVSDTVHIRLINNADEPPSGTHWPGRRPLKSLDKLQVNYSMQASRYFAGSQRTNLSEACGGKLLQSSGTIQTPRFPFNYPPRVSCVWIIEMPNNEQQVRLKFGTFDLELSTNCNDELEIRNGPAASSPLMGTFCGNSLESRVLIAPSSVVWLHFSSDSSLNRRGFNLEFDGARSGCGGLLTAPSGQIDSPNYPYAYAHTAECDWSIEVSLGNRILLSIVDLDLRNLPDSSSSDGDSSNQRKASATSNTTIKCRLEGPFAEYLEIRDVINANGNDETGAGAAGKSLGRWCAAEQLRDSATGRMQIVSSENKLRVVYRAQAQDTKGGFRLRYETQCQSERELSGASGVIETPGYPTDYTRSVCFWLVRVPLGSNLSVAIVDYAANPRAYSIDLDELSESNWQRTTTVSPRSATTKTTTISDTPSMNDAQIERQRVKRSSVRFWAGQVRADRARVTLADLLRPLPAKFLHDLANAQARNTSMINYFNSSQSLYNFTLIKALNSPSHFLAQPPNERHFRISGGPNLLAIYVKPTRRLRIEWRVESPCGGDILLSDHVTAMRHVRFDERLNLTQRMLAKPLECLWLVTSYPVHKYRIDINLSSDMRQPTTDLNLPTNRAKTLGACNETTLQVFDGTNLRAPLLFENCDTLVRNEPLVGTSHQLLVRYLSPGLKQSATRGLVGRNFDFFSFMSASDDCWENTLEIKSPFLVPSQSVVVSPGYPDQYDWRTSKCSRIFTAMGRNRLRFTIDELDIPQAASGDNDESSSPAEYADGTGGFLDEDKCLKSGSYLQIRSLSDVRSTLCGRFDRASGLGSSVGDTLKRSVIVTRYETSFVDFVNIGLTRGRWKLRYERLCGSHLPAMNKAEDLSTPDYPGRPQWPHQQQQQQLSASVTDRVCIWRIYSDWQGDDVGKKIQFNLLNLLGPTDEDGGAFSGKVEPSKFGDCLRLYEGYNISLAQGSFNLTEMDAAMEPRLKLCSRKDLAYGSMSFVSRGSEITVMTTGSLVAKFQVRLHDNSCGGHYLMERAEFASPGYPEPYAPNLDCHYFIAGTPGAQLELAFEKFDLGALASADPISSSGDDDSANCDLVDHVEVRQLLSLKRVEFSLRDLFSGTAMQDKYDQFDIAEILNMGRQQAPDYSQAIDGYFYEAANPTTRTATIENNSSSLLDKLRNETEMASYETRRRTLNRMLELTYLQQLFNEARSGTSFLQVFGANRKIAISLEEFYEHSTLIGRFCGRTVPKTLKNLRDEVLIRFRTYSKAAEATESAMRTKQQQARGFLASYSMQFGGEIQLSAANHTRGFISSPFYPDKRMQDSYIKWTIVAPLGASIEFDLLDLDVGSTSKCSSDYVLNLYNGATWREKSLIVPLCGYLSYKGLQTPTMRLIWEQALEGKTSVRKLPISLAYSEQAQVNLLRRFRTSGNVASVVFTSIRKPGAFLLRYRMVLDDSNVEPGRNGRNETLAMVNDLLMEPVTETEESLGEEEREMLQVSPLKNNLASQPDLACSKVVKLQLEGSPSLSARSDNNSDWNVTLTGDEFQLRSPQWPRELLQTSGLECNWLLFTNDNTNIVLQMAPQQQFADYADGAHYKPPSTDACLQNVDSSDSQLATDRPRSHVVIYDGASTLAPVLARICLPAGPQQLESSRRHMLVRYVYAPAASRPAAPSSDGDSPQAALNSGGSSLFRAQAHVGRCGGQYHVTEYGTIQYPPASRRAASGRQGAPAEYENNLDCLYLLFAATTEHIFNVMLSSSEFSIAAEPSNENCTIGDYIELRDLPIASDQFDYAPGAIRAGRSLGRFCAGHKPTVDLVSSGPALVVEFRTDARNVGRGFNLHVTSVYPERARCPWGVTHLERNSYARLASPGWPHGLRGERRCSFIVSAPLADSLVVSLIHLRRPTSRAPNGTLVCKDSFGYVDDGEARSMRFMGKAWRNLGMGTRLSSYNLRDMMQNLPCARYTTSAGPIEASVEFEKPVERISESVYASMLLKRWASDSLAPIWTSSNTLYLEYNSRDLLPGEGFEAIVRVDDRPPGRACGGLVSSAPGKNLIESASFGKLFAANESERHIQCSWKLEFQAPAQMERAIKYGTAWNANGTPSATRASSKPSEVWNSYLVFDVIEIPPKAQNATVMEAENTPVDSESHQLCGLNRLVVGNENLYTTQLVCGYFSNLPTYFLALNPALPYALHLRTRNLEQVVYAKWPMEGGPSSTGGARYVFEGRKKLHRGLRAYLHETACPRVQVLPDGALLFRSHANFTASNDSSTNDSYQPGICQWPVSLPAGKYELIFTRINLRPGQGSRPPQLDYPEDGSHGVLDHLALRASNHPDSPVLARIFASNQLESARHKLHFNVSLELDVIFIAGLEQLAKGLNRFPEKQQPKLAAPPTSSQPPVYGFEAMLVLSQASNVSDFCRHDSDFNIYSLIRNRDRSRYYTPVLTAGASYSKNAHCSIDMMIDNNFRFNLTFVNFFDMEPSSKCAHDSVAIYDLVDADDKGDALRSGLTKTPSTATPSKKKRTSARPAAAAATTTTSTQRPTSTTNTWKSPENVYARTSLNRFGSVEARMIGRWCGRRLPSGSFLSLGNKIRIDFNSNEHLEGKGFILEWSAVPL